MKRKVATLSSVALVVGLGLTAPVVATTATAQDDGVNVIPIQITGPPSERLNMVIFGDGYTADEMDKFREDVDRNQNVQWSIEPFRSYRHYFNVYMVETPSVDSGISCDPDDGNVRRDTVFNLQYSGSCPAGALARGITYGSGGAAARTQILNEHLAPLGVTGNNVQTLALANTFTYGGIGGTHATTSGGSPQGPLVSVHELGHSTGNNFPDEYPYSSRDVGPPQRACYTGGEPSSFNHTLMTSEEMIANEAKWWRWLGEESEAGGIIKAADPDGWESGLTRPCGVWRPSQHSMMRWIGFYFDQVGREHMTQRISGMRFANEMPLNATPGGEVGAQDVVWVETMHPRYHELDVTWRINDELVPGTNNSRNLELAGLDVSAGDIVHVTVQDPTEFVRDPDFKDGPRLTQTRQWIVGTPLPEVDAEVEFTAATTTERAVGHDEVVYVETTHPTGRVLDVTWRVDGEVVPDTNNSRNLNVSTLGLEPGAYELTATVTDPAGPGSDTEAWIIDNVLPTAPRTLTEPLATLGGDVEHNVYFNEFDMLLEPQDDQPGFVVGELRLNRDGWFNYFGFPEEPFGTPFTFSHSGRDVKALTYGNLGTGGLSKATFEQSYGPDDPGGPFVPGFGTHDIEHRAIDAAGNIGDADEYRATVLPGELAECTTTLSGNQSRVIVTSGVTCLEDAQVNGGVTVRGGGSLVASGSSINGGLTAGGAAAVQLFDTTVNGQTRISGTVSDVTIAGSTFNSGLTLTDNSQVQANDQFRQFGYEYGPILVGSEVNGRLTCSGNSAEVRDFGAQNQVNGHQAGDCADL